MVLRLSWSCQTSLLLWAKFSRRNAFLLFIPLCLVNSEYIIISYKVFSLLKLLKPLENKAGKHFKTVTSTVGFQFDSI